MNLALHLFGNWKWTGPAEPALWMTRLLDWRSELLLGGCPFPDTAHQVAEQAGARGIPFRVLDSLSKHWNPVRGARAAVQLAQIAAEEAPQVIQAHLDSDHAVALRARQRLPHGCLVVRCVHDAGPTSARRRRLLQQSDLVLCATPGLARALEKELGWPEGSVGVFETSVDLERFHATPELEQRGRQRLGIPAGATVLGIVARIQRHRRFDLLVETWRRLKAQGSPPLLVVLGRGTEEEELLGRPVREAGLEDCILCPGYQSGTDYVEALAACDAGIFLVPGTDVSCRAIREWMAMGRGVLGSQRPPLPEILEEGRTGWLLPENAEHWARILQRPGLRAELSNLGEAALATARERFDPCRAGEDLTALYEAALRARDPASPAAQRATSCVAAVRPGAAARARQWARSRGLAGRPALLHPGRSRDCVLDVLALLRQTGARHLLLEPHREWDRPFLEELRDTHGITVTLLREQPARTAADRWLEGLVADVWTPPAEPGLAQEDAEASPRLNWTSA